MSCVAGQDTTVRGSRLVPGMEGSMRGAMPVLEDTRFWRPVVAAILIVTLFLALTPPSPVLSLSYEVINNNDDTNPGSLRWAVMQANTSVGVADTITFSAAVTGTILLGGGAIPIDDDVTITGPGAATLTVSANNVSRVFRISNSATVHISGLTIADGLSANGADGYPPTDGQDGGGILAEGGTQLTLTGCVLRDNATGNGGAGEGNAQGGYGGNGGAIACEGTLTLSGCTVDRNYTGDGGQAEYGGGYGGNGGAIACVGTLSLNRCTFEDNHTGIGGKSNISDGGNGGDGGAIWANGPISIESCQLYNNYAGTGGDADSSSKTCGDGGSGGACYLCCTGSGGSISDTSFSNNLAGDGADGDDPDSGDGGDGGAISLICGDLKLLRCVFEENEAGDGGTVASGGGYGGYGGVGGGIAALDGTSIELRESTLTNNTAGDAGSHQTSTYGRNGARGGGLYSNGITLLESCLATGNRAGDGGSTPAASGGSGGYGGGIYGGEGAELTVLRTTIEGNYAGNGGGGGGVGGGGGGLSCRQALTMKACTISGNHVGTAGFPYADDGVGGGIGLFGDIEPQLSVIVNCTIAGNLGPADGWDEGGGGLFIDMAECHLTHCTISGNSAIRGGGVMVEPLLGGSDTSEPGQVPEPQPTLLLKNCIIAQNEADTAPDIFDSWWDEYGMEGGIVSHGCNLIGDDEGFSLVYASGAPDDVFGADPMLEALGDNGGPTETMALRSGSPAIDAVEEGRCRTVDGDPVDEDQRGETRPMNGDREGAVLCDIGAYEAPGPLEAIRAAEPDEPEKRLPLPASMNACYMALGACQVLPGQAVQVSVNVCNGGEVKGSQSVVLSVNGVAEQSQTVAVSGGSCKTVVFTVAKSVPGTYDIDVNGMHGQLTVLAPRLIQGTVPSQQVDGLGTAGIIAIVVVMIVLVLGLVVVFRQS
jgi:hypothetical protein